MAYERMVENIDKALELLRNGTFPNIAGPVFIAGTLGAVRKILTTPTEEERRIRELVNHPLPPAMR